jgi:hypothetical protein
MPNAPKRVSDRLAAGLKRFQPVLASAKARDIGEADTVTIVTDMLADIFGFEKYSEITSEYAIRGTFCDLATKLDGQLKTLIEVKAIGSELKDPHVKQAVDYAANQGVDWCILTNGASWRVYRVTFTKPIDAELVVEFDLCAMDAKSDAHLDTLYLICKEGWVKSVIGDYHTQKQALSRFFIGAMLVTDPVVEVVRRELRRVSPDVRIDLDQIREVLTNEVIKREVVEGEKADEARRKIARAATKSLRTTTSKPAEAPRVEPPGIPMPVSEFPPPDVEKA